MITFRCKQSGNTVSFTDMDTIDSMRKETHYEEVKDEIKAKDDETIIAEQKDAPQESPTDNSSEGKSNGQGNEKREVLKKRGRPVKR